MNYHHHPLPLPSPPKKYKKEIIIFTESNKHIVGVTAISADLQQTHFFMDSYMCQLA